MKIDNFAVIIPTYGRPDKVFTINSLRSCGYTGDIYLLCDDSDVTLQRYLDNYGDKVLVFNKKDYFGKFDKMDNFGNTNCVVYARNAIWDIVKTLGLDYFIVADDDYSAFSYRISSEGEFVNRKISNLDEVFLAYLTFLVDADLDVVCFAQGGDYIGGAFNYRVIKGFLHVRKMMNLFFFNTNKPIEFKGTINEDLTSSVLEGSIGKKIITVILNSINQKDTQSQSGGLTEIYLDLGTYVKSFYSVMANPSCVELSAIHTSNPRIHHEVTWKKAVPKFIRQDS